MKPPPVIRTRTEARRLGLKKYFIGNPCRRGHTAERYTSSGYCIECGKITNRRWKVANPAKVAESVRRWNEINPERRNEIARRWQKENQEQTKEYRKNNRMTIRAREMGYRKKNRKVQAALAILETLAAEDPSLKAIMEEINDNV